MLKIRRSQDRLIFNMGIPTLIRWHLYIEACPRALCQYQDSLSWDCLIIIMGIPIQVRQGLYIEMGPRGWFNKKMPFYQYRKYHYGDKTILWPSYLHNGIYYAGKMASLYWIRAQVYIQEIYGYSTHWGWSKIDALSQRTSSNAFSRMKMFEFQLKKVCSKGF